MDYNMLIETFGDINSVEFKGSKLQFCDNDDIGDFIINGVVLDVQVCAVSSNGRVALCAFRSSEEYSKVCEGELCGSSNKVLCIAGISLSGHILQKMDITVNAGKDIITVLGIERLR